MEIYLSYPSSDFLDARAIFEVLENAGHTIAHDWTENAEFCRDTGFPGSRKDALHDLWFVAQCDALIAVVLPGGLSPGQLVDLGAALVADRRVIVVEQNEPFGHFFGVLVEKVPTLKAALAALEQTP